MSICKNKIINLCTSTTGIYNQNQQKYGTYPYCSNCVNDVVKKKIKRKIKSILVANGFFTDVKCAYCSKSKTIDAITLSYDDKFTYDNAFDITSANKLIKMFCKKCARLAKNKVQDCPFITDLLLTKCNVFTEPNLPETNLVDSDDDPDDKADLLKAMEMSKEVDKQKTDVDKPKVDVEKIKDRVSTLEDKISKMNLAYLLCAVCSDDEIYNRLLNMSVK